MFSRVTLKAVNAGDAGKGKGAPRLRNPGLRKSSSADQHYLQIQLQIHKETLFKMHLMFVDSPNGKRQYTLRKVVDANVSKSAHPARFSPDDKFSRHRVTLKKRYGLLITQQKDLKVLGQ